MIALKNIYLKLIQEFKKNRLRVIIFRGQAVVLHRLAIMSKDGDWIIRENTAEKYLFYKVE